MSHHTYIALTLMFGLFLSGNHIQAADPSPRHPHTPIVTTKPVLVKFPQSMREHTLANMRDHLAALGEIQDHLAAHRFEDASKVAEQRLGMSSLELHGAHHVAKFMPQGMQDAGTAMHRAASQFAVIAQDSAVDKDLQKSLSALAVLTQTCVACHAAYRLH